MAPPERLDRNEAILRAKMERELDKGARFLEERVQRMFGGPGAWLLNPLAGLAYRAVGRDGVVRRAQRQFDALLRAARAHATRPEAIFDGHLTSYLEHDEAWARANRGHVRFPELEGLVREVYVARVEAVSALLHGGAGEGYHDLLRSAFPRRDLAEQVLEREFLYAERLLAMAEAERGLMHAPPLVGTEVFRVLRDTYAWYRDNVRRSLDEVYAA